MAVKSMSMQDIEKPELLMADMRELDVRELEYENELYAEYITPIRQKEIRDKCNDNLVAFLEANPAKINVELLYYLTYAILSLIATYEYNVGLMFKAAKAHDVEEFLEKESK